MTWTAGHDRSRLVRLLTPDRELLKLDYFARVEKWEDKVKEYERLDNWPLARLILLLVNLHLVTAGY